MLRILCCIMAPAVAVAIDARACTNVSQAGDFVKAGRSFRVRVSDGGRPVVGLRLYAAGLQATTDTDGIATFSNMPSGLYSVVVDHDDSILTHASVNISATGPAGVIIALTWPAIPPIAVRSLKGTLRFPPDIQAGPGPIASLSLLEGISGRRLKTGEITPNGHFDFGDVESGLYFLQLNKPRARADGAGMIGVTVDPTAASQWLDIELGWTSCGMWYTDRNRCPQSDLWIDQLCGAITDETGAPIPNADIVVSYAGERPSQVDHLLSDRDGKFTWLQSQAGTYALTIGSPGFTSLRTVIHIGASSDTGCRERLRVQLGIGGGSACSTADIQRIPSR